MVLIFEVEVEDICHKLDAHSQGHLSHKTWLGVKESSYHTVLTTQFFNDLGLSHDALPLVTIDFLSFSTGSSLGQ